MSTADVQLEEAILDCVEVELLPASDFPERFFEVEVGDVAHHAAGILLNREAVRDYIGAVCPVPMSAEFPYLDSVKGLFPSGRKPLTLQVYIEGEEDPIERPYGHTVRLSAHKKAQFTDFEAVHVPNIDGEGSAAVGWVAHTPYLGALPKGDRVRGIRARAGNIQIGGEDVFDHLFREERFNRWCVGELHVLDSRIVPNSRRDYFVPGPHLRNLENHLQPLFYSISTRCRRNSSDRNRAKKALSTLFDAEDLYGLATSGYLSSAHSEALVEKTLQDLKRLRQSEAKGKLGAVPLGRLDDLERQISSRTGDPLPRRFGGMDEAEVAIYQGVFATLIELASSPRAARDTIEIILESASKRRQDDVDKTSEDDPCDS